MLTTQDNIKTYQLPRKYYRNPQEFFQNTLYHKTESIGGHYRLPLSDVNYKVALKYHVSKGNIPDNIREFVYEKIVDEMCNGKNKVIFKSTDLTENEKIKLKDWLIENHQMTCKLSNDEINVAWKALEDYTI